jgi:hypothetical protein
MSKRARGGLGASSDAAKLQSPEAEAIMVAQVADAIDAEAAADAAIPLLFAHVNGSLSTAEAGIAADAVPADVIADRQLQHQPCSSLAAFQTEVKPAGPSGALPLSPGRNRQLFLATVTPQSMTCNLSTAIVGQGLKHNLVAVVIARFPVQKGPPARQHVTLCDAHGSTGLTVWNADVHKFPKEVLGGVVTVTRASISLYQGKKNLVLSKDSTVQVSTTTPSPMADWWAALSQQHPLPLPAALVAADNSIINVFGVLAFVAHEFKEVNGQMRVLTSVHLACQTARFQLRGWDLEHDTMRLIDSLKDLVVQVRRVRISCYAELKVGEILESPLGSSFSQFTDAELTRHWAE